MITLKQVLANIDRSTNPIIIFPDIDRAWDDSIMSTTRIHLAALAHEYTDSGFSEDWDYMTTDDNVLWGVMDTEVTKVTVLPKSNTVIVHFYFPNDLFFGYGR